MADSLRQQLVDTMSTALATITTANGWQTDIGTNAFEWCPIALQDDDIPSVNLMDSASAFERVGFDDYKQTLMVTVRAVVSNGTSTGDDMRKAHQDLVKWAHNSNDTTWGGLCTTSRIVSSDAGIEQQESVYGWVTLSVEAEFFHESGDESTQAGT